jgi:hypothetical protein
LAKFVDRSMRGQKGVGDSEIEAILDKVTAVESFALPITNISKRNLSRS